MNDPLFRIVLADELLPVQAFFNALPDDEFLHVLRKMLNGVSIGYNAVGCELPDEDDPSAPKTGILFYVGQEEKWLPNDEVMLHLQEAIAAYLTTHPWDSAQADVLLSDAKAVFG